MKINGLKLHRVSSWFLAASATLTIYTGYDYSRRWITNLDLFFFIHLVSEWFFIGLLIFHIVLTKKFFKMRYRKIFSGLTKKKAALLKWLRLFQLITKWIIVVLAILVITSGLVTYEWYSLIFGDLFSFAPHIDFDLYLTLSIIVHTGIGAKFYLIRRKVKNFGSNVLIVALVASLSVGVVYINLPMGLALPQVSIGNTTYDFVPEEVNTTRPDLFGNGSFSMFDILVHLNDRGEIVMEYHFNTSMNTHVIESIDGEEDYWYNAYYSGGYVEQNVYRMDHYPWKIGSTLILYQESQSFLNSVFSTFRDEVVRKSANNGSVVVPIIVIDGYSVANYHEFYNVNITAHNYRNDTLQSGVITVLDVILTLADLGNITYGLQFYESLGVAEYVYSFWIETINEDTTTGRCGFVYEEGDTFYQYPRANYIQLNADIRILNSPEYIRFFWKCL